tara:strand:+ start:34 stop:327 length:294 start_codon:yes stop_codon:yes gene_type:complete
LDGEERATVFKCSSLQSRSLHAERFRINCRKYILVPNSGLTKYPIMTKDNQSSKQEDDKKEIKELKDKAEKLQKLLDMTRKTLDYDHNRKFGKYEMM